MYCTFGGICGITFSYHFAFVDSYVNEVLINSDLQNASFSYYYYSLLVAIILVAKFVYTKSIFNPLKFLTLGICLIAIIIANTDLITLRMYIAEQIIFGFLAAILLVPSHALVYQLFNDTRNYFDGMFWFVSFLPYLQLHLTFFVSCLELKH
ncbi:MAG: hypothetical protein WCN27_00105 [Alphaproteobacteria bacterium]